MDFMDIAALPAITAVVYLCAFFLKNLCRSERFCRLIPPVCGLLGLAYKQSREKGSGENGGAGGTLSDSTAPSDNAHQEDDGNDYA